jgi:Ni/Co efflux regulator RcnB
MKLRTLGLAALLLAGAATSATAQEGRWRSGSRGPADSTPAQAQPSAPARAAPPAPQGGQPHWGGDRSGWNRGDGDRSGWNRNAGNAAGGARAPGDRSGWDHGAQNRSGWNHDPPGPSGWNRNAEAGRDWRQDGDRRAWNGQNWNGQGWNGQGQGWNGRAWDWRDGGRQGYYSAYRYRAPAWRAPQGFYVRTWRYGDVLPHGWYGPDYWIGPWWDYALTEPPPGYHWVRVGDDALLVDDFDGRIVQVVNDIFW